MPDAMQHSPSETPHVLALAGGVGGAKLALGLAHVLPPNHLTIVGNTGDDDTFHGLHVSPDLDTLMYTLAGLSNPAQGWGLTGETFHVLEMLKRYGQPSWFGLGDTDLATHIVRTKLLRDGQSLSAVTAFLAGQLGIQPLLAPMSDDPVRTIADTLEGPLAFQVYFVQRHCEPRILGVEFRGATKAKPSPAFLHALHTADILVYCPSNPIVSIGPILAIPGVVEAIRSFRGPRIAVSPIIGNQALKGPAAKMLEELGEDVSSVGVAKRLAGLCDLLVLDQQDTSLLPAVRAVGMDATATNTIMQSAADKEQLARDVLAVAMAKR